MAQNDKNKVIKFGTSESQEVPTVICHSVLMAESHGAGTLVTKLDNGYAFAYLNKRTSVSISDRCLLIKLFDYGAERVPLQMQYTYQVHGDDGVALIGCDIDDDYDYDVDVGQVLWDSHQK